MDLAELVKQVKNSVLCQDIHTKAIFLLGMLYQQTIQQEENEDLEQF